MTTPDLVSFCEAAFVISSLRSKENPGILRYAEDDWRLGERARSFVQGLLDTIPNAPIYLLWEVQSEKSGQDCWAA
jgi:hypothetical protein